MMTQTRFAIDEIGTQSPPIIGEAILKPKEIPFDQHFICNRPFGLLVREKRTKFVLFMGHVVDPVGKEKKDGK